MRISSAIAAVFLVLALAGCANPYTTYYRDIAGQGGENRTIHIAAFTGEPAVRNSSGDPKLDIRRMYESGYGLIGTSGFVAPAQGAAGAAEQAKKVGAAIVLVHSQYQNTATGSLPITMPTTTTAYSSGTVSAYSPYGGFGTGTYSGTTTVYGTSTTYVPYSVDRYKQWALYFAPLKREGIGVFIGSTSDEQRRTAGTNRGTAVIAIRRDSPAFHADILPGDIILSINGEDVDDLRSSLLVLEKARGTNVSFSISRNGRPITKTFFYPAGSW